jgi:predicted SAM-dependent methyltransferase
MSRWLHLGCGDHKLPEPWENFDKQEVDITFPLYFDNGGAKFIFAEHVIEHVSLHDGISFLSQCKRVLCLGGVLRLSFPDLTKIGIDALPLYAKQLKKETGKAVHSIEEVWLSIAMDWGHKSVWTADMARRIIKAIGFDYILTLPYGQSIHHSDLNGIDGRHLSEGLELARAETTVIEATKVR